MEAEKTPPTTTTTEKKPEQEVKNDLPTNSPYVDDSGSLEDYKMKAYGAQGHQEVKAGLGGGSTDAPTPSGGGSTAAAEKAP
ncbi:unnamed protein product [Eruca vesicaria subsp. sativa]|uniref:Late embryogenesis abundant protein, LEA-18 n=1 Tax=Eruca vesicaria subsp. sativa TaxID=29727 RepID=A0ABC8K3R3_ERUVS|nr:unnamed protein product [Eruca vesicaria subsp. sativa]